MGGWGGGVDGRARKQTLICLARRTPHATIRPKHHTSAHATHPAAEERDGVLVGLDLAHHPHHLPLVLPQLGGVHARGALSSCEERVRREL
jgi:hypothetical protein